MVISVIQLGRVDYAIGLRLQQTLVDLRQQDKIANVLLLLEHTPVITLGRNAKRANVLAGDKFLKQRGVELFECDRGGDVTFHGPGQLVGYPIFDLRSFLDERGRRKTLGAVEYVRCIEEALIRACADYGIATERVPGMTGVWTSAAHAPSRAQAKIAAIGVHISRGVTSHGFALNVTDEPLDYFKLIVPCGIASKSVTSMQTELSTNVVMNQDAPDHQPASLLGERIGASESKEPAPSLDKVAQAVALHFGHVFRSQIAWVDSLDALLGRTVGVPMRPPEELRQLRKDETFWV